jgi:hypothetical protein
VALSVSTSATASPLFTASPSFLFHLAIVPSVIVGESCGIAMEMAMVHLSPASGAKSYAT